MRNYCRYNTTHPADTSFHAAGEHMHLLTRAARWMSIPLDPRSCVLRSSYLVPKENVYFVTGPWLGISLPLSHVRSCMQVRRFLSIKITKDLSSMELPWLGRQAPSGLDRYGSLPGFILPARVAQHLCHSGLVCPLHRRGKLAEGKQLAARLREQEALPV